MGKRRGRGGTAVVAPVLAGALAVALGTDAAGAASGDRADEYTFTSGTTGELVTCSLTGSFSSTETSTGAWALTAVVRVVGADSPECDDGIAHVVAHHESGADDAFSGGGNYVEVSTTTPTEVTSITYQLYLNSCACYTPEYTAPK
jgi:hypothetical protein